MFNEISLDTVAASLAYAMGIEAPAQAAAPAAPLVEYIDTALAGKKADRILMYNPDAVGQWVQEKYPFWLEEVVANTDLHLPLCSVMPSVTPVCFGTMYTGAQPAVHGIQEYAKPVIRIDTLFDAMLRAGKKCAIVSNPKCSLNLIYREREMDYYEGTSPDDVNAIAAALILEDKYDLLVVYNGNFDYRMHRAGPESPEALSELRCNTRSYNMLRRMVQTHWKHHNTLMAFAMDHGCHEIASQMTPGERKGTHGDNIPEDMNILHHYKIYPAE